MVSTGTSRRMKYVIWKNLLLKADQLSLFDRKPARGGPFIGPRGGKWADAAHTIPWKEQKGRRATTAATVPEDLMLIQKVEFHDRERGRLDAIRQSLPSGKLRQDVKFARDLHRRARNNFQRVMSADHDYGAARDVAKRAISATDDVEVSLGKEKRRAERAALKQATPAQAASVTAAIKKAEELGIPAEAAGPRSIALGGPASQDTTLGKWNGEKGPDARRIVSAKKAKDWLDLFHERIKREHENSKARLAESKASPPLPSPKASFRQEMELRRAKNLILSGNTYAIKEEIKASGGVWDRVKKVWLMPDVASLNAMRQRMAAAPQPRRSSVSSVSSSNERKASDRQASYAWSLVQRLHGDDYGTFTTYGMQSLTPDSISRMSAKDVSSLIDLLRSELF